MNITIKISVDHQQGVNVSAPRDINIQIVGNEEDQSPRSPTRNLRWGNLKSPSVSTETAPSTKSEEHSGAGPASAVGSWTWDWEAHEETESKLYDDKSATHGTGEDESKIDYSEGKSDTDEEKGWSSSSSSELDSFEAKVRNLKRLAADFRATCSRLESIEQSEAPRDLTECERCRKYEDRIRNRTGAIVDLGKIKQMVKETLDEEKKRMEW